MDETQDADRLPHQKARTDAVRDIAEEIPPGKRKEISLTKLKSLGDSHTRTQKAESETTEQIKEKGKIGGSKVG